MSKLLTSELDAGIITLLLIADHENKVAQAKFKELARSFEAESDVRASDDASLTTYIAFLRVDFGGSEEELAVQEFECLAHLGGDAGSER